MWINLLYIYILKVKGCSIFDFLILYRGGGGLYYVDIFDIGIDVLIVF